MPRIQEDIKKDVVDELYWDSRVDASQVFVEVDAEGTVTLRGTVPTRTARFSAEADARMTPDVVTVENELKVDRPKIVPDQELMSNVTEMLGWASEVDSSQIAVTVRSGIVTLEGPVPSYWEKERAKELAANVTGVVEVIDELAVVPTESVRDQVVADYLIRALERQLHTDIDSVDVTVEEGEVTLSGTVPDWPSYRAAEETAGSTRGVLAVNNHLTIAESA